jgi:hypothetical protein
MGVAGSTQRIYHDEENAELGKGNGTGTGADAANADGDAANADADAEAAAAEETPSASELKMKNVNNWKSFLTDIIEMKDGKNDLKEVILVDKANKEDEYINKGIVIDEKVIKNFTSGDGDYLPELILFTGDVGLKKKDGTEIKLDTAAALSLSDTEAGRKGPKQKLKKDVKFADIKKTIFNSIIEGARIAKKHTVYRRILKEYIADTKVFKKAMKEENISGAKDAIKAGEEDAAETAKAVIKEKEVPKEGGADDDDDDNQDGGSISGASISGASISSSHASMSSHSSMSNASISNASISSQASSNNASISGGGSDDEEGGSGSDYEGGLNVIGFRNADDKLKNKRKADYKKFKKDVRADFATKQKAFFNDEVEMSKFMDENDAELLALYYNGKIPGKWINKDVPNEPQNMAEKLVNAINAYSIPEEGAPAGAEGDVVEGEGDGEVKAETPAEGETTEVKAVETPAAAVPENPAANVAAIVEAGVPKALGGGDEVAPVAQSGGGATKKKKRHTRKKRQCINISINVGDKNLIENESSSSSSSSSSDSSTSDSSSSSDDEDANASLKTKKKHKGKYKIN